jgi:hypothetical protein
LNTCLDFGKITLLSICFQCTITIKRNTHVVSIMYHDFEGPYDIVELCIIHVK